MDGVGPGPRRDRVARRVHIRPTSELTGRIHSVGLHHRVGVDHRGQRTRRVVGQAGERRRHTPTQAGIHPSEQSPVLGGRVVGVGRGSR